MKSFVVLPTYNEIKNLEKMILSLLALPNALQVLIVDDNSPDGTGVMADKLAQRFNGQVYVHHRKKKEGLGRAYLDGFQKALDLGAENILQMDCDFSHPVDLIPEMLKVLNKKDFVLASRYIKGGGTQNWGLLRQLISRGGNFYARKVLGTPIRDLTGGFKAFKSDVVKFLLQCPLDSSGYSFQIETTSFAKAAGFSFQEIPFIFLDRVEGISKMNKSIVLEAFAKTWTLRSRLKSVKKISLPSSTLDSGVLVEPFA